MVFVTARGLLKTKAKYNSNTYLVANGVDFEFFQAFSLGELIVPEDVKGLATPMLGFVRGIQSWVDFQLIRRAATKRRHWTIVLVGPVGSTAEVSVIEGLRNVHLVGRKTKEDVPRYIRVFDVCINPLKLNNLTEYVNPLEVYEYLAMGNPAVSISMPELLHLCGGIYFGDTVGEFVVAIERALDEDEIHLQEQKREIARSHSWERILDAALLKIQQML